MYQQPKGQHRPKVPKLDAQENFLTREKVSTREMEKISRYVTFEVLTTVIMTITLSWH